MNRSPVLISVLGSLFAISAQGAHASDVAGPARIQVHVPHTATARMSANLISRAERAITGYVAACSSGEVHSLSRVTTSDLRIEYALDEPGRYLSLDADSLQSSCATFDSVKTRISDIWIFPTHDAASVFVQYEAEASAGATPRRQLALVEMRGDRIARMLNFAAAPSTLVASAMPVRQPCVCE